MSAGISGSYDGEGLNVSAKSATAPGPVAQQSPDVWAQGAATGTAPGGQGRQSLMRTDRRGRLRTSSEAARSGTAISVGGGDQVLSVCTRKIWIGTAGNLIVRLADDTADVTFTALAIGVYDLAIAVVRSTTTAAGVLLF